MGQIDMAIEDFSKVLSLDESHVNAAFARASCLNLKGDFAGAIEDYTRALEKDNAKSLNLSNSINKRSLLRNSSIKKDEPYPKNEGFQFVTKRNTKYN